MPRFSHLSAHSHYSLLEALPQIDPLVKAATYYGMPALALTDKNNLYGAIEFYKACKKEKIKPILGVDADFEMFGKTGHIVFLAENLDGYRNLLKLVSKAQLENPGAPKTKAEHLAAHGKGLIALVPDTALSGPGTEEFVETLRKSLGRQNVYARLGWNGDRERLIRTAGVAKALSMPLAAADGTYYLKPEDREARDIVRKIANPAAEPDGNDRAFISIETALERYRDFPDALKHAEEIVDRASVELELGSWIFPRFPLPSGATYGGEI